MASQALQKFSQLSRALSLGALILSLGSCSTSLKSSDDLQATPEELNQKLEELDVEPSALPPEPPAAPSITSLVDAKKTKTSASRPKKGAAATKKAESLALPKSEPTWKPKEWPFGVGEKLTIALRYGVVEGGLATVEVLPPKMLDGVPVLHYKARARSSKMLELFYKIDNTLQSWVGLRDHLPRRQEIEQLETARWGRRVVVFDQNQKIARFYNNITKSNGSKDETRRDDPIGNYAQDILGAMFFYRFLPDLEKANFPVHDRFKEWNAEMKYSGKERVVVPAGTFNTLRFNVKPRIAGNLEPRGDVAIWISDDSAKILVQFKAKIKIGSLTGELKEYQPGKAMEYPLPVMKTPTTLDSMGQWVR